MAVKLRSEYLSTNRGIIKIVQIIIGIILSFMVCRYWESGNYSCFSEYRTGYVGTLNYIVLILNIVWFVLNFINIRNWKVERIYAIICAVLFFIALGLLIFYFIDARLEAGYNIIGMILIGVMACLFLWDVQILQGESSNY
uniref:MARVEL domain-containing protein n=1 Tax=Acrobeloides nanus TaxID=290746 RepID=A0A914ER26_9BILA